MANSTNILTTLTSYFNTNFSLVNKYYQGKVHPNDTEFVEFNVISVDAKLAELNGDTSGIEDIGIIRVNCYASLELGGIARASVMADTVKELFDTLLISGTANVQMEVGHTQHVGFNETLQRYEMLAIVPYYGK